MKSCKQHSYTVSGAEKALNKAGCHHYYSYTGKWRETWKRQQRKACAIKAPLTGVGVMILENRNGMVYWTRWHVCCHGNRKRNAFVEPPGGSIWLRRGARSIWWEAVDTEMGHVTHQERPREPPLLPGMQVFLILAGRSSFQQSVGRHCGVLPCYIQHALEGRA